MSVSGRGTFAGRACATTSRAYSKVWRFRRRRACRVGRLLSGGSASVQAIIAVCRFVSIKSCDLTFQNLWLAPSATTTTGENWWEAWLGKSQNLAQISCCLDCQLRAAVFEGTCLKQLKPLVLQHVISCIAADGTEGCLAPRPPGPTSCPAGLSRGNHSLGVALHSWCHLQAAAGATS